MGCNDACHRCFAWRNYVANLHVPDTQLIAHYSQLSLSQSRQQQKSASLGDNSFLFDDECLFKIAEVIQKSEWHCTPPDLWLVADLFPLRAERKRRQVQAPWPSSLKSCIDDPTSHPSPLAFSSQSLHRIPQQKSGPLTHLSEFPFFIFSPESRLARPGFMHRRGMLGLTGYVGMEC